MRSLSNLQKNILRIIFVAIGVLFIIIAIRNGMLDYIRQIGSLLCFDCMGLS